MSVLDKLKFWKKEEEPLGPMEGEAFGALKEPSMPGGELGGLAPLPGETTPPAMPGKLPEEGGPELPPIEGLETPEGQMPEITAAERRLPVQVAQPPLAAAPTPTGQMEVISAKLDAIRASLDSINVRLESLERATHGKAKQTWYRET